MSIFPKTAIYKTSSPYDLEEKRYQEEKQRQFELQMKQMQHVHAMELQAKAAAIQEATVKQVFPSNHELINRIMEMQKKYIDRLEAENARLNETVARLTSNVVVPTGT
jgi:hypothetical protein